MHVLAYLVSKCDGINDTNIFSKESMSKITRYRSKYKSQNDKGQVYRRSGMLSTFISSDQLNIQLQASFNPFASGVQ